MANKRPGFTLEQHNELGDEMRRLDETMARMFIDIQTAYGKTSPPSRLMRRAWETMRKARSKLDDAACLENPTDDTVLGAYYGTRRSGREERP